MTEILGYTKEEFKELRLINGELVEGILKDGSLLSDWWLSKIEKAISQHNELLIKKIEEEHKNISDELFELLPLNLMYKNVDRKTMFNWIKTRLDNIITLIKNSK